MSNFQLRHPDDGLLLRYLDGELPGRKARQIRSHLEACWQCRAQAAELQNTIGDSVRYRKNVLIPNLPVPPQPWRSLEFDRVEAELAAESLLPRLVRFLSPNRNPRVRWALPATAVLVLSFLLIRQLGQAPKVEAAALLQRAVIASESHPVAPKRLRITTRTGQMTRVVGVAHKPAAREIEIERLFDSANYDWQDPLSAKSYAAWRGGLPRFQDTVASQPNSYEIKTTSEDSELLSATIKLRSSDLEPVEGRFEFRNRDWVELTELVDQQTTPASNIAGTIGGMPRQPGRPPSPHNISVEPSEPSGPSAVSEELQVVAALHQLGADLGDPLEISREGRQVLVSGTGISPQRQQQIHGLLDRLPHVLVRFDDPAFPAGATPVQSEPVTRDAAGPEKSTYAARIEERLGGRPQFERFSSSVMDWTDTAMTRAYALHRLAQQFSAEAEGQMTSEDLRTLHKLGREHLASFAKEVQRIANTVNPVIKGLGPGSAEIQARPDPIAWQSASEDLLVSARKAETLLAVVLGLAPAENASGNVPAQLIGILGELSNRIELSQRLLVDR
jgi:hypothetical protein